MSFFSQPLFVRLSVSQSLAVWMLAVVLLGSGQLLATELDSPWPEDYDVTLRVASDDEPADFSTVQPACDLALELAARGQRVRVRVGSGHYRETVEMVGLEGQDYAPIAIEAEETGRAVFSDSQIVNGWEAGDSGYFEKDFPDGERVKMVFVQSVRLESRRPEQALSPGQFRVIGDQVQLMPPNGATVADGLVEVAVESEVPLLCIQNLDTVAVSGLYLRQSGGTGLMVKDCSAVQVEHATSEHHFIAGYHFENIERLRLFNVDALRNGKEGTKAVSIAQMEVISGAASNNGFRVKSDQINFSESYGMLCQSVKKLSVRNFQAADNQGTGVSVAGADEVLLRRSKLLNNGAGLTLYSNVQSNVKEVIVAANETAGMLVMDGKCRAEWSIFTGNGEGGGGWQVEAIQKSRLSLEHCIISSPVPTIPLVQVGSLGTVGTFSGNLYWGAEEPFVSHYDGVAFDFAAWQAVTGQDLDSAWGDPMFNAPDEFEFIPLTASIWYQQKKWPVRKLTEDEMTAAREKYLHPAHGSERFEPARDSASGEPLSSASAVDGK